MTWKKLKVQPKWDIRYPLCAGLVFVMFMMSVFISYKHVTICVDGNNIAVNTPYKTPGNILSQAGVQASETDEYEFSEDENGNTVLTVKRALPVVIDYNGAKQEIVTTKATVGEVLENLGYVGNGYKFNCDLQAAVVAGMCIGIEDVPVAMPVAAPSKTVNTNHGEMNYENRVVMEASAYLPEDGNGDGITATGMVAQRGVVAVDPDVIPLGTKVYIPGYGVAVAADTGGAIRGHKIDLCMENYDEAIRFGRRNIDVYILS